MGFFESKSFENLALGEHSVSFKMLKNGDDFKIEDGARGPRAHYRIVDASGASAIGGQTFNAKAAGVIAGMNKSLGFEDDAINELTDGGAGWSEEGCPAAHVVKIVTMWESSEGCRVKLERSDSATDDEPNKWPEIKFLRP